MFRIAVGGIHTECSTYSPVLMQAEDFRVLRGPDLTAADYFAFLPRPDVTVRPLLHARAVPGGPVAGPAYAGFRAEFLDRLRAALPVDAVYLAMHGAMHVEGMHDAEGDWIGAVRETVGPDVPIAVSYDLHGNVSQRIVDAIDIFSAYRTAPHIDVRTTMEAAWEMLLRRLRGSARPGVAWAPIPLLLPGERSSTEDEPARSLYAALPGLDARPGVWKADLMIGYVWADEPRATAAAVVTGEDRAATLAAAEDIAASFWAARDAFRFGPVTGPLAAMLDRAAAATTAPVILADSGDNPTGGGVGDRADVLAALIARGWQGALLAGITDRPAVEACFAAGVGATLTLRIGASLDPAGVAVTTPARVLRLDDGGTPAERQAVVAIGAIGAIGDGITLVLAARRRPYHDLRRLHPPRPRPGDRPPAGGEIRLPLPGSRPPRQPQPDGPDRGRGEPGHPPPRQPPPPARHPALRPRRRIPAAGRRLGPLRPLMAFLAILRRHPVARAGAAGIFLFGFAGAATGPYLPVVAIRELGMSDSVYSLLIFAASVANVLASIAIGLLADRSASYRLPILATTAAGAAGFAAVWLAPSATMLAVAAVGPLAAYAASNALIFAKVRSHAAEFTPAEADEVSSLLRMMISLAWVLVPGIVGLALAGRASLFPAFAIAAAIALVGLVVMAVGLPADRVRPAGTARAGLGDLRAFAGSGLLLRVAGVALASSVLHVNGAVLPLIVTGRAGGTVTDVGVIVGYVALLEVIFIFVWARICRSVAMPVALAAAMVLYFAYLATLGTARGMTQVHVASVLGGIAAAAIITLPIPYLLGLIAGRPGLSASLIAVNQFAGAGIGAAIFAAGSAIGGYPAAALIAGTAGLAGGALILGLDGRRRAAGGAMTRILLEVCVDDPEGLVAARAGGADRLELCAALALGGLTPSPALVAAAAREGIPALAMIRPRAGDFVWTPAEVAAMESEIALLRAAGARGVVIGASLPDGRLDGPTLARLLRAAEGLDTTLHRAIDLTPDPEEAVALAVALAIPRILTSGGAPRAADGVPRLARMIRAAAGRLTIMPGAGISPETLPAFDALPLTEIHASCSAPLPPPAPALAAFGFQPETARRTDPARVAAMRAALDARSEGPP